MLSATLAPDWIRGLLEPSAYAHPVGELRLVETHISWVLLTGAFAYKVKKPVNLGFLDFSTPERRRQACEDELRLNRRYAQALYLDVVPVSLDHGRPRMNGAGPAFEHALRMREFPQADQLDRQLADGRLTLDDMDTLAQRIAGFHAAAPRAPATGPYGEPAGQRRAMRDNLDWLLAGKSGAVQRQLERLCDWSEMRYAVLQPLMTLRKDAGCVREVHGDLHLANLVRLDGSIVPFDCIEFSAELRWIDVLNDIAFLLMDLQLRGRTDLAYRLLNRYLEHTGDYAGIPLLPYYRAYRALVRAKVAKIRRDGSSGLARLQADAELRAYIGQAACWTEAPAPRLILMHGLSGSGKSWVSERLVTALPAIQLRSDIERKRLHGLDAREASGSGVGSGIYTPAGSVQAYARLAELAEAVLAGGETVIVDAAFLQCAQRTAFRALAARLGVGCVILACTAEAAELQRRVACRAAGAGEVSEADAPVLDYQRAHAEPLTAEEAAAAIAVDTTGLSTIETVLARLSPAPLP
jgi:uncharacterized protein